MVDLWAFSLRFGPSVGGGPWGRVGAGPSAVLGVLSGRGGPWGRPWSVPSVALFRSVGWVSFASPSHGAIETPIKATFVKYVFISNPSPCRLKVAFLKHPFLYDDFAPYSFRCAEG